MELVGKGNVPGGGRLPRAQQRFLEPGMGSDISGFWSSRDPCPVIDSYDPKEDRPKGPQLPQRPSEMQSH